jgi:O-antigen/teichoic acid export membrane protein
MILVLPLYNFLVGNEDLFFIFKTQSRLALINILASVALIPILGLIGAAFGLLIATLFNVIAIINKVKHLLNLNFFHVFFKGLFFL